MTRTADDDTRPVMAGRGGLVFAGRRAARGAGAPRVHRQPELDAGRGRGAGRRRLRRRAAPPARARHRRSRTCSRRRWPTGRPRRRPRSTACWPRCRAGGSSSPACRWAGRSPRGSATAAPGARRRRPASTPRVEPPRRRWRGWSQAMRRRRARDHRPASAPTSPTPTPTSGLPGTPLRPLLTLLDGRRRRSQAELGRITCRCSDHQPPQDHVVPPVEQRPPGRARWPARSSASTLERSYHVATLDYDKELVDERIWRRRRRGASRWHFVWNSTDHTSSVGGDNG